MKKKTAIILGVTGQDGSYLLELLLKKNYIIHGVIRKTATGNTKNINHLIKDKRLFNKRFFLQKGDWIGVLLAEFFQLQMNQRTINLILVYLVLKDPSLLDW